MKKILILGVAAVQYDVIKFLKENYTDLEVHAIAMKNDGPGSKIADYFSEINIVDIENIKVYIQQKNIDVIYSVGSDISMPVIGKISEECGLPHFVSSNTAVYCNNKNQMRSMLGTSFEGNIPYQELSRINDFDISIFQSYPLFLKPADSQGQRGVKKITSFEDLSKYFETSKKFSRSGTVILEKYISGQEISVNGYMINGALVFCEISDRITWEKFEGLIHKHIVPSKHKNKTEDKVTELLYRTAIKMEILNGPVYAQMKLENDTPYVIEITPRLDGCHMWKLIYRTYGFNLLKLTLSHLLFNDVTEITNKTLLVNEHKKGILEFLCQEPNTEAHYPKGFFDNSVESFKYYTEKELVRPVNGFFDKIGYKITIKEN